MDILAKGYPDEEHVLVFDNATTHLEQEEDALSAMKLPKFTPKLGSNWVLKLLSWMKTAKLSMAQMGRFSRCKLG